MKRFLFITLSFLIINVYGQNQNDAIVSFSGGTMRYMDIKSKPKKTVGDVFWSQEWNKGNIYLFTGEVIKDYPIRYDLKYQRLEIKTEEDIKVLSIGAVKNFEWISSNGAEKFKNSKSYDINNSGEMFKIVYEGEIGLLKSNKLEILDSNYNPALDVGSQNDKYVKKEKFYVLKDNKIIETKRRKRSILKFFGDKSETVKQWAKENKLKFNKEDHLFRIFEYYNSL